MNLDHALAPWTARAARLIVRRLGDARAHAEAGRIGDAHVRLDELRDGLIGDAGILRDARSAFYRAAFSDHRPLDPEIHQDLAPSAEDESWVRTTPHFALDDGLQLNAILTEARTHLSQSAAATISRADVLAGWETRHRERVASWTRRTLSDSQMALHHVVGRLLVKPELR